MIRFTRTRDLALVRAAIAGDPGVYNASSDDSAPRRADWQPNDHPAIWYVIAHSDGHFIALYTFIPQNAVTAEIHTTRVFGRGAAEQLAGAVRWFGCETSVRRIVAAIPATNRAAVRCALRAGFRQHGRDPKSWLKDGRLVDRVLVGISIE